MKKTYKKIIWGFFSVPRHAADWAEQNEYRITTLTTVAIACGFLYILVGLLFGFLPSWGE